MSKRADEAKAARHAGAVLNAADRALLQGRAIGAECPMCGRWAARPSEHAFLRCAICGHEWRANDGGENRSFGLDYEIACGAETFDRINPYCIRADGSFRPCMPHEIRDSGRRRARTRRSP